MKNLLTLIFVLLSYITYSQTYQTIGSGDWNSDSVWLTPPGIPPTDGTQNNFTIIINEGHDVILQGDFIFKNQLTLIVCGSLHVKQNLGQDDDVNLEGNGLYLEVCCGGELIVEGNLRLKNIGKLNINGTFVVDGIYGHQANSGNCIYTSIPECGGSISTPDGDPPHIENFLLGEEDDCMSGHTPALPIELYSFEAQQIGEFIELKWVTLSEINNDYFTIQKSHNMHDWNIVSYVNGAGDSNQKLTYRITDKNPYEGISYYKLTQTDFDGKFEVFQPISIQFNVVYDETYINKLYNEIVISTRNADNVITIFDVAGRIIHREYIGDGVNKINVSEIKNTVIIVVFKNNNNTITKKFILTNDR